MRILEESKGFRIDDWQRRQSPSPRDKRYDLHLAWRRLQSRMRTMGRSLEQMARTWPSCPPCPHPSPRRSCRSRASSSPYDFTKNKILATMSDQSQPLNATSPSSNMSSQFQSFMTGFAEKLKPLSSQASKGFSQVSQVRPPIRHLHPPHQGLDANCGTNLPTMLILVR